MSVTKSSVSPKIELAFQAALHAAAEFVGNTAPNPPVGAAVLDENENILSVGAHEKAGLPHAEPKAVSALSPEQRARAHTICVTFEPCNHQGRTGPCTEALLKTPIRRVIYAISDPTHGGAHRLQTAGCLVEQLPESHPLAQKARKQLLPFLMRVSTNLPYVVLKTAHQLHENQIRTFLEKPISDPALFSKSMIPVSGAKTFTSPDSLKLAHQLRKESDAIITASGTVIADSPLFTVRHVKDHAEKKRVLLVAQGKREIPNEWMRQRSQRGFQVGAFTPTRENWIPLLNELAQQDILQILIEAGPKFSRWILESQFWNEHWIIAHSLDNPSAMDQIDTKFNRRVNTQS